MDILIRLKNEESRETLTTNEIAAQAWVFFLDGFDTTSTSLLYCVYMLAINPDVQTKARNIILESFKKHNGEFTYEMLTELSFISQVVKRLDYIH